jgi:cobalt/nickel transport system permease protein
LHHVVLEQWSRGGSWLHRRDPRAKIIACLFVLVLAGTVRHNAGWAFALYLAALACATASARIPLRGALARAAVVIPFSLAMAVVSWLSGDPHRGAALVAKSYVSAFAVLLLVSTTPLPMLLRGLQALGVPRFLLTIAQFLYRYLFVISEEAQHMLAAARARGSEARRGRARLLVFRLMAGAIAVLFARSYARAEGIHRAMMARGFQGTFPLISDLRFLPADVAMLAIAVSVAASIRIAV